MNYEQYKMLKELWNIKRQEAKDEDKKNEAIIRKKINELVDVEGVEIIGVYDYGLYGWNIEMRCVDENGKSLFGTTINIYYKNEKKFDGTIKKGVEVRASSISFDNDDKTELGKVLALGKLAQSFDELEPIFDELDRDKVRAFYEADRLTDKAKWELLDEYEKQFESELDEANEYTYKNEQKVIITKITPKFVHFEDLHSDGWSVTQKERKDAFLRTLADLKFKEQEKQEQEQ